MMSVGEYHWQLKNEFEDPNKDTTSSAETAVKRTVEEVLEDAKPGREASNECRMLGRALRSFCSETEYAKNNPEYSGSDHAELLETAERYTRNNYENGKHLAKDIVVGFTAKSLNQQPVIRKPVQET